jgi:diadenosine tetraphosphate (Ap4A) HIT family hydrolase
MSAAPPWFLHPRLAADTSPIGDLPLSRLLLMNDANYPWLLLVPRCAGAEEIVDLDEVQRIGLVGEIAVVSAALKAITAADKLNIAAIGNIVSQLHVHVVARRRSDPAWPRPVWGALPPRPYHSQEREQLLAAIRRAVALV